MSDILRGSTPSVFSRPVLDFLDFKGFSPHQAAWKFTDGGRHLEVRVGDLHAGRSLAIDELLLLQADGVGEHEVGWSAYTKSARRTSEGMLKLAVPAPDPGRAAFGRLAGVTAYPDVMLVDDTPTRSCTPFVPATRLQGPRRRATPLPLRSTSSSRLDASTTGTPSDWTLRHGSERAEVGGIFVRRSREAP